ncbi:MAG TPA: CPBP family intramembrane glutamic endopeptidase [Gemmatimonadales bacterium]|nr:CPBP family intramembrane glutamic endopeptidase [Gemmatimonadales bacterium]
MASAKTYWTATRAPRYSLLFALPLLLLYEILAFALSHDAIAGVRNGADVLLKSLFVLLGGRRGLIVFGIVLVGTGAVLVWQDLRAHGGKLRPRYFLGMAAESVLYALLFGLVAGTITHMLLTGRPFAALAPMDRLDLPTQLMVSLGAGIYEELLFRVLLVSALARLARGGFGWSPLAAGAFATLLGALVFSAFHYVGPYGDPLELPSFTFRAVAGVLFSGLYLVRGLGITAWTHALYDVFLTVLR